MPRRAAFIGRSRDNDIRLTDRTVSRRHAELTLTDDNRIYLTDCGSKYGTHIRIGSGWQPIRQRFVGPNDLLRLGDFQIGVGDVLARMSGGDAPEAPASRCPAGPVERNPSTGEVRPKT